MGHVPTTKAPPLPQVRGAFFCLGRPRCRAQPGKARGMARSTTRRAGASIPPMSGFSFLPALTSPAGAKEAANERGQAGGLKSFRGGGHAQGLGASPGGTVCSSDARLLIQINGRRNRRSPGPPPWVSAHDRADRDHRPLAAGGAGKGGRRSRGAPFVAAAFDLDGSLRSDQRLRLPPNQRRQARLRLVASA